MARQIDSGSRFLPFRRVFSRPFRQQLEAISMEVGRDEASIRVSVRADGRVRLAFGTGEEFVGSCEDLPLRVGRAARRLLDSALPFVDLLPAVPPGGPASGAAVRIALHTDAGIHAGESGIADLRAERSPLAPLWRTFSDLLEPLIGVLFKTTVSALPDPHEIPGLTRARSLWGKP